MKNKGIVLKFLCTNPSCSFSESELIVKSTLSYVSSSGKASFVVPKICPKCKFGLELLNFISGSVEIKEDEIFKK